MRDKSEAEIEAGNSAVSHYMWTQEKVLTERVNFPFVFGGVFAKNLGLAFFL